MSHTATMPPRGAGSLRAKIVFPVALFGFVFTIVAIGLLYRTAEDDFHSRLLHRAESRAATLSALSRTATTLPELQRFAEAMHTEPGFPIVLMTGGQAERVIASSNPAWLGKSPDELPPRYTKALKKVSGVWEPHKRLVNHKQWFLWAQSLRMHNPVLKGLDGSRGTLLLVQDTALLEPALLRYTQLLAAVFGILFILLSLVLYYLLQQAVLNPTAAIAKHLHRFRYGEEHTKIPLPPGYDEISYLETAIPQFLAQQADTRRELQNAHADAIRTADDYRQRNQELEQQVHTIEVRHALAFGELEQRRRQVEEQHHQVRITLEQKINDQSQLVHKDYQERTARYLEELETQHREECQVLYETQMQLRDFARYLEEMLETERTRVARTINEDVGQVLTTIKSHLSWLQRGLLGDEQARSMAEEKLFEVFALINQTTINLRRIAIELRPLLLNKVGLANALAVYIRIFEDRTGIACDAHVAPDIDLDDSHALGVYRLLQDIMNYMGRFSAIGKMYINLTRFEQELLLEVSHSGHALPDSEVQRVQRLAVIGMQEQAHRLGGKIYIPPYMPGHDAMMIRLEIPGIVRTLPRVQSL